MACGSPAQNPIDLQSIKLIWGQPNTATDRFLVRFRIPRLTLIDSIQFQLKITIIQMSIDNESKMAWGGPAQRTKEQFAFIFN